MPELGENVAIVKISDFLEHKENECPFCNDEGKEFDKKNKNPRTIIDADPEEDVQLALKNAIGNNPGKLGSNMKSKGAKRPKSWVIRNKTGNVHLNQMLERQRFRVVMPNPHHLIPGNESLKPCSEIHKWIFSKYGEIKEDLGYDINHAYNGIWLPSNNAMRNVTQYSKKTGNKDFRLAYVEAAISAAQNMNGDLNNNTNDKSRNYYGACFHDRHYKPYSAFVQKILAKIALRISKISQFGMKCPFVADQDSGGKKEKPIDPPYALINKLNQVSDRLRSYLSLPIVNFPVRTSQLMLELWKKNKMLTK